MLPTASRSRSPRPRASPSRASTSSWSVRWRPTSARSASRSPTRARASATPTSASCARPASRRSDARLERPGPEEPQTQKPRTQKGREMTLHKVDARKRRHVRVRKKVRGTAERPRLAVFRSNKHVYAQLIDDVAGRTVASASTGEKASGGSGATVEAAKAVGQRLGERAKSAGIDTVVFDRGGFKYHGRIAAVADGARAAGLEF